MTRTDNYEQRFGHRAEEVRRAETLARQAESLVRWWTIVAVIAGLALLVSLIQLAVEIWVRL
jgi:hypothetical protein